MTATATTRCLTAVILMLVAQQHAFAAPQAKAKPEDISFSQSIEVKWKKDKALVTYKQRRGKKTDTKRYTVSNMDELRDQNLPAYRLYLTSKGIDMSVAETKPFDLELIPGTTSSSGSSTIERRPSRYSEQPSGPSNSSIFGGGWQVSGMVNNNGNIRRYNESGTFGNGLTGNRSTGNGFTGGQRMNEQTAAQLRRMMQQSESPQIRQLLGNMLQQGGNR